MYEKHRSLTIDVKNFRHRHKNIDVLKKIDHRCSSLVGALKDIMKGETN